MRDASRDPFDAEILAGSFARRAPGIAFSEKNWRAFTQCLFFRLLPKLDVAGSSPVARS